MDHLEFQSDEPLLSGFTSIEAIRNLSPEKINSGPLVNIIGILKDQQAPIITSGTHAKYTLEIVDHSTQGESYGLKVNIFWSMDKMPTSVKRADIVLIRKIKVQTYAGNISVKTNYATEIHFLGSKNVPNSPAFSLKSVAWSSYPRTQKGAPTVAETRYGAWLHSKLADLELPSDTEFEERTKVSMNVRDKFNLLKNIKCDTATSIFVNLIGEVIKIHDSPFDHLTLYLSDYTTNPKFYNYVWGNGFDDQNEAQDVWGYLPKRKETIKKNEWPGPYGRMTIQMTVYDSQAIYVRDNIKANQWVLLSNVQIKYGRQGGLLEGYLRGDDRICVRALEPSQESAAANADSTEARLQDAIKRKFEWTKKFQQQQKAIQGEGPEIGSKRKRGSEDDAIEPQKLNSKQRRKLERAAAEKKVKEAELRKLKLQNLNPNIKCSFPDQDPVSIKHILKPANLDLEGQNAKAPFTNTKYRANVRIVDYFPSRIEDFAVGFRSSEFDMLSDYSGEEDSDAEMRREIWHSGKGFSKNCWEWRFALQVEDADCESTGSKDRMWLMVDNQSAQMLLNIPDDASSLRSSPQLLTQVREQMFKLWGDLEERKSATLPRPTAPAPSKTQSTSSFMSSPAPASSPTPRAWPSMADGDSDDENTISQESRRIQCGQRSQDSVLEERLANTMVRIGENDGKEQRQLMVSNKGFTCCIKQYGIKVAEDDPILANAGEGTRWQRMFGLFGTMID